MVFAFAKILKEKANTEWLFNEYKGISKLEFDFKDKEQPIDYTYYVASSMQERSYEDILI
jgi:secreted Zn-dependent insulinase-like peptidase